MSEPRERFVFPGEVALWVSLRHIPRVGDTIVILSSAAECAKFPAMGPTYFDVTRVEFELDYSGREEGDELVNIYLVEQAGR